MAAFPMSNYWYVVYSTPDQAEGEDMDVESVWFVPDEDDHPRNLTTTFEELIYARQLDVREVLDTLRAHKWHR